MRCWFQLITISLLSLCAGCGLLSSAVKLTSKAMQRCAVETDPPGAEIVLNGRHVGNAPCEVAYPLDPGRSQFDFAARLDGYETSTHTYERFPSYVLLKLTPKLDQAALVADVAVTCAFPPAAPTEPPASVAVLDFQIDDDLSQSIGLVLADYCRERVQGSGRFLLVDRENMKAILSEADFAATFECDDTRCLVDFGRKLRAQKIIHGRVHRVGGTFVLTLTMVDVATATVEAIRNVRTGGVIERLLDLVSPATCALLREALGLPTTFHPASTQPVATSSQD